MNSEGQNIIVIKRTFAANQKTVIAAWQWWEQPLLNVPAETGEQPAAGDAADARPTVQFEKVLNRLVGRFNGTEYTAAFFEPQR